MAIGIIALADLIRGWDSVKTDELARILGLEPTGPLRQGFVPPRVLIALVDTVSPELMAVSRGWLALSAHVILIYDVRWLDDPELIELAEQQDPPPLPATVIKWKRDSDLRDVLARARALDEPEPAATAPIVPDHEVASGPWIALEKPQLLWVAQHLEAFDLDARVVAPSDLLFASDAAGRTSGGVIVNRDPVHPVRWTGGRMTLRWQYRDTYLDAMRHDYPCGPAKKLYGYSDNYPVQVCMSPTLEAFVARFDHDVTFSTAIPLQWQRAGDVDVAAFPRDLQRAAFFARDPSSPTYELDREDEDARDVAPSVVLGPARYAIGSPHEIWRVTRPADHPEPSPYGDFVKLCDANAGYAVYTFDHELVRRGRGQLLGGWYRHATIEDAGSYWREDLVSGARTRLGPADLRHCLDPEDETIVRDAILEGRLDDATKLRDGHPCETAALEGYLAIPGTRNVLVVTERAVRVI